MHPLLSKIESAYDLHSMSPTELDQVADVTAWIDPEGPPEILAFARDEVVDDGGGHRAHHRARDEAQG